MKKPRFNLKNKAHKETLISLVAFFKGQRLVYSSGMKVPPKYWNFNALRVKEVQEFIDHVHINKRLDVVEAAASKISKKYELAGEALTQIAFRREMDTILSGRDRENAKNDFTSYFANLVEDRSNSPKYAHGSIQVYNSTTKHLNRYVRNKSIKFEDLTIDFFKGFIKYLYRLKFSDNYVNKLLSTIHTVLNEATEEGVNRNMAYKSRKISVGKTDTDNVYLTEEEIQKLAILDLNARPSLDRVRDLFIIAAYTGLRFSDFTNLKPENIQLIEGKRTFNVLTQKTTQRVVIPIHPLVESVLEKYGFNLPEAISNQKMNDALKVLCKLAGLTQLVTKRHYQGGKVTELSYQKWQLVSSHTGRRSFATNAYKSGLQMLSIMRITGHKKPETFLKYIKFDNEENAILMAKHPFFNPANSIVQ